jgi:hypothetical protein
VEDAAVEDVRHHPRAEPGDVAERRDPVLGDAQPAVANQAVLT